MNPAESSHLWQRVIEVYGRRLRENPAAADCLRALNLSDLSSLAQVQAGYSDGSLPTLLPESGEVVEILRTKGLLDAAGHEALQGSLVIPVFGPAGDFRGFTSIRANPGSVPTETLVPAGAEGLVAGVLAKDGSPLLVTNRCLDALALWQTGFRNVSAVLSPADHVPDLLCSIPPAQRRELFICFTGEPIPSRAVEQLTESGTHQVSIVQWPEPFQGARDYLAAHSRAELEALFPATRAREIPFTPTPDAVTLSYQGRYYEARAIQRPSPDRLRATVRAFDEGGRFVVDTIDFYHSRTRRSFVAEVGRLWSQSLEVIEEDLSRLTKAIEAHVAASPGAGPAMVGSDQAEGLKLGRHPDLLAEILRDIAALGVVGEEVTTLLGYLAMTSRKLADPLSLLILSGSGAGKSHLQDTILRLCPEEDLVKLTALTDQALFYGGESSLRHKVLALEELAGARGADYAIRNLISARKLVIETTAKNPLTGKLQAQINTVHGPTAVFQTTTNPHTDAETRSRFLLVSVDESPAQTRAILQRQRQIHTLEGLRQSQARESIIRRHHAFQRLLRPLAVVNPFAPLLSYPDEHLQVRREHPKYLQLILAVAFLHQMQRPIQHDRDLGDYVEVTLDDVEFANDIAHRVFGNSWADLSQPGRDLLSLVEEFMKHKAAASGAAHDTFHRRELREALHWGDTRLRVHLKELVNLEYVLPISGRAGVAYRYRLLGSAGQGERRWLSGLKSVEQLRNEAGLPADPAGPAATPQVHMCGVTEGGSRGQSTDCEGTGQTPQVLPGSLIPVRCPQGTSL